MLKEDLIWQHNSYGDMLKWLFQSTLPQGERRRPHAVASIFWSISIHAPTRGATISFGQSSFRCPFQSTLPQGERQFSVALVRSLGWFQSTLPQGERQFRTLKTDIFTLYFNPRSHKGSDSTETGSSSSLWNFNPRSHKGSDSIGSRSTKAVSYFNPRSHKGSDPSYGASWSVYCHFNPRSHKGSDWICIIVFTV